MAANFATTFDLWLATLDLFLYDFSGFKHNDLPIPLKTWHTWFKTYTSNFVATVIAGFIQEIGYANS